MKRGPKASRVTRGLRALLVLSLALAFVLLAIPEPDANLLAGGSASGLLIPEVLVGLFRADAVSFTCQGAWSVTQAGGEPTPLKAGAVLTLRLSGKRISWEVSGSGGSKTTDDFGNLLISGGSGSDGPFVSVKSQEGASAGCAGRSYRGNIIAIVDGGALLIANALDMEEYVQSVVGGEIPDAWPVEANRAQAVAARSYAAHRTLLSRDRAGRDYTSAFNGLSAADVLIWASDQVYRGVGEETSVTVEAASSTRGQVLTYGGTPVAAYYHSDAGGMTEDPLYVWGKSVPYLTPVCEEPHESPHESWTVALSPSEVEAALDRLGLGLAGRPDALYGTQGGASGRWSLLSVRSEGSEASVKGNDLRIALPQVKSTLFSSYMVGGGRFTTGSLSSGMRFNVAGADGVENGVELGSTFVVGGLGEIVLPPTAAVVVSGLKAERPPEIILQGAGWGHGVGLSQWGARGMALEGKDARTILMFYYPGATLEQWW